MRASSSLAWSVLLSVLQSTPLAHAAVTAPPAEAFGALPQTNYADLSPDGNTLAWAELSGEETKVVIFDVTTRKTKLAKAIDPAMKLRDLSWSDNDTLLIEVSIINPRSFNEKNRFEFFRTVSLDINSGELHMMLMAGGRRARVTGAYLLATHVSKPKTVIMSTFDYAGTAHRAELGTRLVDKRKDSGWVLSLYEVDTRSGDGTEIEQGTQYTSQWIVDKDGKAVARSEWDPKGDVFRVLAKNGRGWQEILHQENRGRPLLAGLTRDGTAIVALGLEDQDKSKLMALPLDGTATSVLFEDPGQEVANVKRDRFTLVPKAAVTGGTNPEVRWFDPADQRRSDAVLKAFPGRRVNLYSQSQDGQRVVAYVDSPSVPPSYYLVDFKTHKADTIGDEYPELANAKLGTVQVISYKARDGVAIPAYLTLPPGSDGKALPLVVLPHDGPEDRDWPRFDWWAQFLATRGYAVLQPQFRGSTGLGNQFRLAGRREWGGRMQNDVTDGVKYLVDQGTADPRRVCIVGAGYGGYAALAGTAFTPELYACAASVNGISSLPELMSWTQSHRGSESNSLGDLQDSIGPGLDPKLATSSPLNAVQQVRAPVLIIYSSEDTVVPPSQSEDMARALKQGGKTVTLVKLNGDDHWLSRGETRVRMLKEVDGFLATHLGK
jgi:dipeptidyl aminopeptidase/acylaminoacyl peptidase